ncbi:finger 233-like [Octopus vulgaris]|uniref:Finger 233-like n=2 Tax=Octopus TaxID=6643 RepID=A0AA36AKK2_OCTVU|nr:zinc finger protein 233-like [Octopus sinensis]CAI9716372.1 finger 233-like [Octopus vulgaris]
MSEKDSYVCTQPAHVTPLQIPKLKIERRKTGPDKKGAKVANHKCDICGKSYTELSYLKAHQVVSHGPNAAKPNKCNIPSLKTFKCDICSKQFSRNYHLDRHRMTHTGEKPFKCKVCSRTFSRNYHLHRHAFIHTGEKPYSCEVCAKAFSRTDKLKKHTKTHLAPFREVKSTR